MLKLSLMRAGLCATAALVLALTAPADAKSCSERLRTCRGFLGQDQGRFARVSRQMRRIPTNLPRQRLLGEQVRVQGMRLRQTVSAPRHFNAFAPSSTASSGATHLKPLSWWRAQVNCRLA
jgi:hypothetical protein